SATGNQTIGSGITLSSDSRMTFTISGGTFTNNNATIATSAVGTNALIIQSTGSTATTAGFTLTGAGTYFMPNGGGLQLLAQNATNGFVSLSNGSTESVQSSGQVYISTPRLTFGTGTSLASNAASAFSLDS